MHKLLNHIANSICKSLIIFSFLLIGTTANAEQSAEEIIKSRKALFSKNYNTAKKVQTLSSNGDFDEAKKLMLEMSENYKTLKNMFPDNTKEGFKTEAAPAIWEEKDAFNALMDQSASDMVKLSSVIEGNDNIKGVLGQLMWKNCKACHSKYRTEH